MVFHDDDLVFCLIFAYTIVIKLKRVNFKIKDVNSAQNF